ALRQAGAVLLGATTVEEISGAVAGAVASLLPPQTPHQVLVEPDTGTGGPGAAFEVPSGEVLSAKAVEPTLTARLGVPEAVLCHHLVVIDETGAQVRVGALYLGAPKRRLIGLRAASGVLANQAALALERLRLTAEVHRRANEEYFRTLVQNAS